MRTVFFTIFALLLTPTIAAQENTTFREGAIASPFWGAPLWADMHSTITRGEVAISLNAPEYDWAQYGDSYRPFIFSNLGADIPLWAGTFNSDKYGFSATIPFLIDVWLDMFERTTAPVVNTSYRFGAPEFKFYHRVDKGWMKNYVISLSPMKHECAHIGDELTIMRINEGLPLTRINVSYNYAEIGLTINDAPSFNYAKKLHTFKLGLLVLHDFENGWYNIMPAEGDITLVKPSSIPFEFYAQYQYQTKTSKNGFQGVASVEMRRRSKYHYPLYYTDTNEDWVMLEIPEYHALGINTFVGVRYNRAEQGRFSRIGLGLRVYNGVNPYGQFRSHPMYQQYGLALIFE